MRTKRNSERITSLEIYVSIPRNVYTACASEICIASNALLDVILCLPLLISMFKISIFMQKKSIIIFPTTYTLNEPSIILASLFTSRQ